MTADETLTAVPVQDSGRSQSRAVTILLWVIQIALAAFFVAAAIPKLAGIQGTTEMFGVIGLGQWFRYLVAVLEVAGAIGLLIPRLAGVAALCLAGVMAGATFTQAFVLHGGLLAPVVPGVICASIACARWRQIKELAALVRR